MRRGLLVVAALATLTATMLPSSAFDIGKQYSCDSTSAASISPVTGNAPTCGFDLTCAGDVPCVYLVRIDVSGGGLVSGAMRATLKIGGGDVTFFDENGSPVDPPACSGAFSCSDSADGQKGMVIEVATEQGFGAAVVTVNCDGGGLAVVETVHCSATSVTNLGDVN